MSFTCTTIFSPFPIPIPIPIPIPFPICFRERDRDGDRERAKGSALVETGRRASRRAFPRGAWEREGNPNLPLNLSHSFPVREKIVETLAPSLYTDSMPEPTIIFP